MALSFNQHPVATMNHQSMSEDEKAYFKALGARIAQRRKQLGLTQTQLAEALSIAQQTFASYEVGRHRIPVSLLPALAQALKVEIEVLLGNAAKSKLKRGPPPQFQQHIERIGTLPKAQQRLVMQMLEGIFAQQDR
jgi:transcriptional regulator with XRE-family HTH domain